MKMHRLPKIRTSVVPRLLGEAGRLQGYSWHEAIATFNLSFFPLSSAPTTGCLVGDCRFWACQMNPTYVLLLLGRKQSIITLE